MVISTPKQHIIETETASAGIKINLIADTIYNLDIKSNFLIFICQQYAHPDKFKCEQMQKVEFPVL